MINLKCLVVVGDIGLSSSRVACKPSDTDSLGSGEAEVRIRPVASHTDRHVIHSYFNTSPESPDGRYVV